MSVTSFALNLISSDPFTAPATPVPGRTSPAEREDRVSSPLGMDDDDDLDDGELADGIRTPVAPSSPADSLPDRVTDDSLLGEEDFEVI